MKIQSLLSLMGSVLVTLAFVPGVARGQDAVTPGPEHEMLKKLEGNWSAKVKMGESESAGTMTYKMECGGLWLVSDFQGTLAEQKFQGRGMDGYDPKKQKYVSVWVDSMTTEPMLFEGTYDKEKRTMTMTAQGPGPDGKPTKYKSVTHMPDSDHQTFSLSTVGADGQEAKVLTIEYTRKK